MRFIWLKILIIFILLFAFSNFCSATHVVGGDLTYRHIANDSFEITLVLYIDCINGNPAAIALDANAMIGVFDTTGNLVKTLLVNRNLPIRINSVNYNCVLPPSNACVDKYTYQYFTTLPFINGGYYLAYQRCCRNISITNIVNPANTGATYWAYVPDTLQTMGYNSSAVFNSVPPNFLCNNNTFIYNHAATDLDGDSLAYELITPYIGADPINNLPRPPSKPPYTPIIWENTFDEKNMMNGAPELTIDSITGVLNVKPRSIGQYVVGIAVKEYRNGKLINTIRRDFQFNVLNCKFNLVSSFTNDIKTCTDTVTFINNSMGADSYLWDFGIDNLQNDTSTLKEPVYLFPGPGKYNIKLKVGNGNCYDSTSALVTIFSDNARFAGNDTTICEGGQVLLGAADTAKYNYIWNTSLYLNDSTLARPLAKPLANIQYIGVRKNDFCTNLDTVNIFIKTISAQFAYSFITNCNTAQIKFDSISQFSEMQWFLNNEKKQLNELEETKYLINQSYQIKLQVKDGLCMDETEKLATVNPTDSIIIIPNVFTPNNDGKNDCFYASGITLDSECNSLKVFNRWGQIMFNSETDGQCWNGDLENKQVSEGVYFYILKNRDKNYHGTITLVR